LKAIHYSDLSLGWIKKKLGEKTASWLVIILLVM